MLTICICTYNIYIYIYAVITAKRLIKNNVSEKKIFLTFTYIKYIKHIRTNNNKGIHLYFWSLRNYIIFFTTQFVSVQFSFLVTYL